MLDSDFERLIQGPLGPVLAQLEAARTKALRSFWLILAGAVVLAVLAFILIPSMTFKIFGAFALLMFGGLAAYVPLGEVGKMLKTPAMAAIGAARGLTHQARDFPPDGYAQIQPLMGGGTSSVFSDRIAGEADGTPFVLYEAKLTRRSGKSHTTVFNGLIVHLQRRAVQGETVVTPDRGLFNFMTPGKGMERVKFEDDPAFDRVFEVYSTRPDEARALLNPVAREQIRAWRAEGVTGRMVVRIAGDSVTATLPHQGDRFEAGSMFKSTPGRERVRAMWDDLDAALVRVHEVRQALG